MQNKQYILFVSGLDKNVKESDLHKLFTEYPVSYIKIAKDHQSKESYGYAFIGIKNSSNKAEEAISRFNYEKMPGYKKTITVCWYNMDRSATKNREDLNIFIKNIDKSVSHKQFHDYYSQFGNIVSLKIAEDDEGESLGYGFVLYESATEADNAIAQTNGKEFHGKEIWAGKFIKNRPKKAIQFNNIYVKNIPLDYSEEKVLSIFAKYGELGSCLVRIPKEVNDKLPEEKKKEILSHKFAFICFKNPESAIKAVNELPFFKLADNKYNDNIKSLIEKSKGKVADQHLHRFAAYLVENYDSSTIFSNNEELESAIANFNLILKEYDGNYLVKDKSDRLQCCQALKKPEREKKMKAIYEKIKKGIREKYKLCNLYVKNLPDDFNDEALREIFEKFGSIRSCRTIKKELVTSYLGIKRSVKVFGYVCFNEKSSAHEAKKALENKPLIGGQKLYVDYHQSKAERNEFLKLNMINKSHKIGGGRPGKMDMVGRGMPQMRQFPGGMNPNMLRKFPNNGPIPGMDMGMYPIEMMMGMQNMNIGMMPQMNMEIDNIHEMDPNAKRDFYGERLYTKISMNANYQLMSEFFSKIVGIFLDLEDPVIERLISDDHYFDLQVRETMRLLAERDQQ